MRLFAIVSVVLSWLVFNAAATDNGLTDLVTWDEHSLFVNNSRVYIFSAEFHYQRLPVPELWPDVFQKLKAEGFNAISVYFFWSYHSASKGEFDFDTSGKNVQKLFDYAKEAGLYVVARAGPYCNAETNGGGLALHISDGSGGVVRTGDETFHQSWLPWITNIGKIIAKNQITNGGPVILNQHENELQETVYSANHTLVIYMEQIKKAFLDAGVVVPSTHNEKGMRSQSWSTDYKNVGGAVNIYGLDSYPGGLDCANPDTGFTIVRTYYQWFQNYSYTQPEYIPEFRGGWFQPWGGGFYDNCASELNPELPDVFFKNNVGQRVNLLNIYMTFGGTNWGHSAAPVVYTSYDYSAGLRETREIRDKLKQMKLLGLFTRVSKDLLKTVMESNGTGNAVSDTAIWTWVLRNPDTDAGFYVLQHDNSRSRDSTTFSVNAKTSTGTISIPNVNLAGRQSKIVVTDYKFGSQTLLYSSAEVLAYANLDVDVLVLYLNVGQVGEFAFKAASNSTFKTFGETTDFKSTTDNGLVKYTFTQTAGTTVVQFSNGVLVYLLDKATAYNFHAPPTTANPDVLPDQHIFVIGPHLVRSVSKDNYGSTIDIIGDSLTSSTIEVYAGSKDIQTISWNGQSIATTQTSFGSLIGNLPGPSTESISLPELTDWKAADSFPEASPTYDDSQWTACDKTTTLSPVKPLTLPVLFSSDYGFYAGQKIYRATFPSTSGNSSNLNITVQSGAAAGFSVWFNGDHIYSHPGNASLNTLSSVISLPRTSLNSTSNSLVVLLDYTGHDQTSVGPAGVENPRGILGASITPSVPTTWKIMGNAGGNLNIDPVRGPMNEGGLYGERLGWHLPSFPTSSWASSSPTTGISKAGVQWYTSTFSLSIPSTLDIPIGIELSADTKVPARVQVWINGYLMAKFVPHIGPQTRFPIPPGVLDTEGGENTIAVSLWAQSDIGAKLDVLRLIGYGVYETGFKVERNTKYLRPQYDEGVRGQKYV